MQKNKELLLYIIIGGLTTLINYIIFISLSILFSIPYWVNSSISWFFSVLFAYISNRKIVFKSSKKILIELFLFVSARLFSGFLTAVFIFIFVDNLNFNPLFILTLSQIFTIILNYILSSKFIFNKKV